MAEKKEKVQDIDPELRKKLEAEAFARVCKAAGTTPDEVENMEKVRVKAKENVEYDTGGISVSINGHSYPPKGVVSRDIAEQVIALASAKRSRLINERIGRDMQVIGAISGGVSYREIKRQDDAGLEVSNQ